MHINWPSCSCADCESYRINLAAQKDEVCDSYADENQRLSDEIERLTVALKAAIRAADLALFVIRKQGVMPNSSWESGFETDMKTARAALNSSTHEQKADDK